MRQKDKEMKLKVKFLEKNRLIKFFMSQNLTINIFVIFNVIVKYRTSFECYLKRKKKHIGRDS